MRKILLVCAIFQALIFSGQLLAGTIKVCAQCPVKSISDAIKMAQPHDTLLVQSGAYNENGLIIDKPLTLLGIGRPVIDGEGQGEIIGIHSDSVTISGMHIKNVGVSHTKDFAAIHVRESDYLQLTDNILTNVFFGMLIEKSANGRIEGNEVSGEGVTRHNSANGIHLWNCKKMTISDNELFNLRDGIYFEFVSESVVERNYSHDNLRYGLHFMFSDEDDYTDNLFRNNGAGVAVMFSKFINMRNNRFVKNWGPVSYGLLLKEIYDAEIENNHFEENTVAIQTDGSTRINYRRNNFVRNGWAVRFTGGCYSNIFTQNNFIANSFDLSYNSKVNDNKFNGNYWSSYTGYDLDRNGVGDVPFRPVNLFSYVVNKTPEAIILLRSFFIDLVNFSEKVSPIFTPDNLMDEGPLMKQVQ